MNIIRNIKTFFAKDEFLKYLFISPLILIIVLIILYPFVLSFFYSFTNKAVGTSHINFIGFQNYISLIRDSIFRKTTYNSLIYVIGTVGGKLIIGLVIALILNQKIIGKNLMRGISFVPWLIPTFIVMFMFRWFFDNTFGIVNEVIVKLGLNPEPIMWLSHPIISKFVVIIVSIWKGIPFFIISILAGLQGVPLDLYDAVSIDGGSWWARFRHITIPHIKGVVFLISVMSIVWTLNDFESVFLLTGGGPNHHTEIFSTLTYTTAFNFGSLGKAISVSIFMMPFLGFLIYLTTRNIYKQQEYF